MIRSLLIDDEPDSILVLSHLLEIHCPEVQVVGEAGGVAMALEQIETKSPDLLFLDINLVNGDGFELLDRSRPQNLEVIFVTAHDNHALRAFQYSAVDYLLKPIAGADLRKAIDKVTNKFLNNTRDNHLDVLMDNIRALHASEQKMAVPTVNGLSFVSLRDIVRLEASGAYTNIITSDGKTLLSIRLIKEYETILPANIFYRVHSSHIVNLNKIQRYQKGRGGYLVMEDDSMIEVATRRREEFLSKVLK